MLCHPNQLVRVAIVGFMCSTLSQLKLGKINEEDLYFRHTDVTRIRGDMG
jgi:hypothetical protein